MALEVARRHGSPDDVATQSLILQTEGLLAAAAGEADRARAAIADAVRCEPRDEQPDAVGQAYLAAADVEQILGNTSQERERLTAAQALFAAKGNLVEVRKVSRRLRDLTANG
jgi:hypothetical protein